MVSLLQRAHGDGRLTLAELDSRLTAALQTKTQAELQPLVADQTDATALTAPAGAELATMRPASPGYSQQDPLRLEGGDRRVGVWTVPPFLRIDQESRWLLLDFQRAATSTDVIDIEVVGGAGWVLLVVPVGWGVDVDRLSNGWGTRSVKAPKQPAAGAPLLVIHGTVGAGRLRVRTPSRRDRRRARRSAG